MKLKKLVATMCTGLMLGSFLFGGATVDAATTHTKTKSGSSNFTKEWENLTTYKVGNTVVGHMVWGYNTYMINEDYVWTKATECYSTPSIYREGYDTAWKVGSEKGKNVYSKYEITHKTYNVKYRIKFSSTYSNMTNSTTPSSIKG